MALDPQAKTVLEQFAKAQLPAYSAVGAVEARRLYRESRAPFIPPKPELALVEDRSIDGPHGAISIRFYRPLGGGEEPELPALVYFHGGGWTIGDLESHDVICRTLAATAGCAVVAVDYRLAPEHRFPVGLDDCWAALQWVIAEGGVLGIDTGRVAIGGDSAGGNLAAAVALMARDAGLTLAYQLLIYPQLDLACDKPSHTLFAEGYGLTRASIAWFIGNYVRSAADVADWRASPLRAPSLEGVAPAYVVTAGFDPLRDEGAAYAERLVEAGVPARHVPFDGMIHGFAGMGRVIDAANRMLAEAGKALAEALA
ncbi:MAG: alpha/beta hydrolase [Alphaproteobacteria bacterium]|nr:alpha/beta hydrolase [Alphaproteobacteria bacterium]